MERKWNGSPHQKVPKNQGQARWDRTNHGKLRLRLPLHLAVPEEYRGQRYSLGLVDDAASRAKADLLVAQINLELHQGQLKTLPPYSQTSKVSEESVIVSKASTAPKHELVKALKNRLTVKELLQQWLEHRMAHSGASAATLALDKVKAHKLEIAAGEVDVSALSPRHIQKAVGALRLCREGDRYLAKWRSAWNWGIEIGVVDFNPWSSVRLPSKPRKEPKPFTRREVEKILAVLKEGWPDWEPLVHFCFATGLRPGEALALHQEHIPSDCSYVMVVDCLDRGGIPKGKTKTAASRRVVPVPLSIRALVPQVLGKAGKNALHNFRRSVWKPALAAAQVPYRPPYHLRHTALSHWLDAGVALPDAARLAGTSISMLSRHYLNAVRPPEVPDWMATNLHT